MWTTILRTTVDESEIKMKRVFISLPFGNPDQGKVLMRFRNAELYFMKLLKEGICPVSPVVTGFPLCQKYGVSAQFEHWDEYCMEELKTCDEVHILMLDGWEHSEGLKKELELAQSRDIPVFYMSQQELM